MGPLTINKLNHLNRKLCRQTIIKVLRKMILKRFPMSHNFLEIYIQVKIVALRANKFKILTSLNLIWFDKNEIHSENMILFHLLLIKIKQKICDWLKFHKIHFRIISLTGARTHIHVVLSIKLIIYLEAERTLKKYLKSLKWIQLLEIRLSMAFKVHAFLKEMVQLHRKDRNHALPLTLLRKIH